MSEPRGRPPFPLRISSWREADQAALAVCVAASLAILAVTWGWRWWSGDRRIEIDREAPRAIPFLVDVNAAQWPELAQIPGVGETLARRIVDTRQRRGAFADHEELREVTGIGPRTLERIRPYLAPLPGSRAVAGP